MLLQISTSSAIPDEFSASDLGYLFAKNPERVQSFDLSFGRAHAFYPAATPENCTFALLLDVDPVALVRGKGGAGKGGSGKKSESGPLAQYVNDRPYVASSFLSVAIAQVLRSAMSGTSRERPELAETALPFEASVEAVPCDGETARRLFEPLGYEVETESFPLDARFPEWGTAPFVRLRLRATLKLSELLSHLYVLLPVLDAEKHYYVGSDEVDKLLRRGTGWLENHPQREWIVSRYLRRQKRLVSEALEKLAPEVEAEAVLDIEEEAIEATTAEATTAEATTAEATTAEATTAEATAAPEKTMPLHQQRIEAVLEVLKSSGARKVLDLGCGEGRLLRELLADRQFEEIVGLDASHRALDIAADKLRLERLPEAKREKIRLIHGALTYRDDRLKGFDAAALVEVIEHLDSVRLSAFERSVFEWARPQTVVITTPNSEYNVKWESLPAGKMRHRDHRFEWSREEFDRWAGEVADKFAYMVETRPLGPVDEEVGAPSQMAIFRHGVADNQKVET